MELLKLKNSDKQNSVKYLLKKDGITIGCGYVFNREINPIEIYIDEKHQSNGYGKLLFNNLIKVLKKEKTPGAIFVLPQTNYKMINIVSKAGGVQISQDNNNVKLIIKLC